MHAVAGILADDQRAVLQQQADVVRVADGVQAAAVAGVLVGLPRY
jgi:hypothetical protein